MINKIAIVLPNLHGGGAERLAIYLANDWDCRGYAVEFVLMKKEGVLLDMLSTSIRVTSLESKRIKWSILPLCRHLKNMQPDVVWAGMWPLTSAAIIAWLLAGRPGKIFTIDHNQLSISCVRDLHVHLLWLKTIIRVTYPLSTGIMAVSKGVAADLKTLSGLPEKRVKVIYNPAATGKSAEPATRGLRNQLWGDGFDYHILGIGTLKPVKNFALLIGAFSKLSQNINAKLIILGEGELRPVLEDMVYMLDLQGRISLPGFVQDPYPWLRSADLFVLSSNNEGLPTVLIEALECGVPIVSTNCSSGPDEILEDGRYGRLVPVDDVDALTNAMIASFHEMPDRQALMNRAKDFSVEKISDQYLDYFGLPRRA